MSPRRNIQKLNEWFDADASSQPTKKKMYFKINQMILRQRMLPYVGASMSCRQPSVDWVILN